MTGASVTGDGPKASPDQIGTLTSITPPFWWVVVAVLIVIGVAVTAWSVFGRVYVTATGLGIVIPASGHLTVVPSNEGGIVTRVLVKQNDVVRAGTVLAEIAQPRIASNLRDAQALVKVLRQEREQQGRQVATYLAARDTSAQGQITALQAKISSLRQSEAFHVKVLADMEDELKRGFVTRDQVERARGDVISSRLSLRDAKTQIQSVRIQKDEDHANAQRQLFGIDQEVLKAEQQVQNLQLALSQAQQVVAPIDGRVASIATAKGKMVGADTPIVTMEPSTHAIQVAAYFQIAAGKQIALHSKANVKIESINSDIFGTAVGTVSYVADLPSTPQSMGNTLANQTLVQQIGRAGAPLLVRIDLQEDPKHPGRVMMSSGRLSPIAVTTGTTAAAQVVIQKAAPISYVIKLFH